MSLNPAFAPELPVGFDEDQVRDFLMSRPDFVRDDPELLAVIARDERHDNVVDIAELARRRLSAKADRAERTASLAFKTAEANLQALARTQAAILCVLDAVDPEDLAARLHGEIADILEADVCVLAIADSTRTTDALCRVGAAIERLVPAESPVLLGPIERERRWLYGHAAPDMASEAIARLEMAPDGRLGIFAAASRDVSKFRFDDGPDLFVFVARVIERVVGRWAADGTL